MRVARVPLFEIEYERPLALLEALDRLGMTLEEAAKANGWVGHTATTLILFNSKLETIRWLKQLGLTARRELVREAIEKLVEQKKTKMITRNSEKQNTKQLQNKR